MAELIRLEVVTPEKYVVSEDVEIVMAPGSLGQFGVLPGHTPFLTPLNIGSIHYRDGKGKPYVVFVSGGFAEVLPDRVTILAESAERSPEIDINRARAALERAQQRLAADKAENVNYERAKAALYRALERIKAFESARN